MTKMKLFLPLMLSSLLSLSLGAPKPYGTAWVSLKTHKTCQRTKSPQNRHCVEIPVYDPRNRSDDAPCYTASFDETMLLSPGKAPRNSVERSHLVPISLRGWAIPALRPGCGDPVDIEVEWTYGSSCVDLGMRSAPSQCRGSYPLQAPSAGNTLILGLNNRPGEVNYDLRLCGNQSLAVAFNPCQSRKTSAAVTIAPSRDNDYLSVLENQDSLRTTATFPIEKELKREGHVWLLGHLAHDIDPNYPVEFKVQVDYSKACTSKLSLKSLPKRVIQPVASNAQPYIANSVVYNGVVCSV